MADPVQRLNHQASAGNGKPAFIRAELEVVQRAIAVSDLEWLRGAAELPDSDAAGGSSSGKPGPPTC